MKRLPLLTKRHVIILVVIVLLFLLVWDFNARLAKLEHLSTSRDNVGTEVGNLQATANTLETQIAFATSDVAVSEWARERGRMVLPGDQVMIPLQPENAAPEPVVTPTTAPQDIENWEVWKILFFGD